MDHLITVVHVENMDLSKLANAKPGAVITALVWLSTLADACVNMKRYTAEQEIQNNEK